MAGPTAAARRRHLDRIERNTVTLVTPEGVPLSLEIAKAGDRLTAFFMDLLAIGFAVAAIGASVALTGAAEAVAPATIAFFLIRNFYFMVFEQKWQGSTPGKRNRRLRVVDAHGGLLSVEAVVVRNLTRDLETFIPLAVLMVPDQIWPTAPPFAPVLAGAWVVVLGLLPLFNRQRRRMGDLIAGTMVVAAPQVELLGDLADRDRPDRAAEPDRYVFTAAQLAFYGVYELQVLERILRSAHTPQMQTQQAAVRARICAKIGWDEAVDDDRDFLAAFYAAQRAHLEGRMLLGDRREDKYAGAAGAVVDAPAAADPAAAGDPAAADAGEPGSADGAPAP